MHSRSGLIVHPHYFKLPGALILLLSFVLRTHAGPEPSQKVYFTEFTANSVGVIDPGNKNALNHIPIPRGAHGIAILPDGSRIFISSDESSVISVIDASTDKIVGTVPTGKQPHGLVVGKDGKFVYAAIFGDNQILEINPATLKVERTFDAANPHNLALSPAGDELFVASQKSGEPGLIDIDLRSGKQKGVLRTETAPRSLNLSPDGSILCATFSDRNEVDFFSANPLKKITAVEVGEAPHHVVFTPDGRFVLTVDQISNDLTIIDSKARRVVGKVTVGQKPHWIAPTDDSKYAYVTDENSNQVSFVDLVEKDVEQTFSVGGGPRKIALLPGKDAGTRGTSKDHSENTPGNNKHAIVKIEGPPPRFVPETVTVEAGTTIEWENSGKDIHTVTDANGQWDSGSLRPGEKYTRQFTVPGTFEYYCIPHRAMGMVGTITVK